MPNPRQSEYVNKIRKYTPFPPKSFENIQVFTTIKLFTKTAIELSIFMYARYNMNNDWLVGCFED